MPLYNINWYRYAVQMLTVDLRKIKLAQYVISLIEPIRITYNDFLQFRRQQLYEAEINGQTIKLKRVLNDTFDPVERRIYITNGDYLSPPIFYDNYKNRPVIFYNNGNSSNPAFYYNNRLGDRANVNFYVHVPDSVFFDKTRVRALVNKYKIFGRTFEIVLI